MGTVTVATFIYMIIDPQAFVHSGPVSKRCKLMAGYGGKGPDSNVMWGPKNC